MNPYHFISYSARDGAEIARQLHDELLAGEPSVGVWMDRSSLHPGFGFGSQMTRALQGCDTLLFVMTTDSVEESSFCTDEWSRALTYKKPVVPLRFDAQRRRLISGLGRGYRPRRNERASGLSSGRGRERRE